MQNPERLQHRLKELMDYCRQHDLTATVQLLERAAVVSNIEISYPAPRRQPEVSPEF